MSISIVYQCIDASLMLSCLSSLYLQDAFINANSMYIHYIDVNLLFVVQFNVQVLLLFHDYPRVILLVGKCFFHIDILL